VLAVFTRACLGEEKLTWMRMIADHAALKRTKWKLSGEGGAAELPGIKPTTLASRMKKMGIERPV